MIIFLKKEVFNPDYQFNCQDAKVTTTDTGYLLAIPLGSCGIEAQDVGDHIRFHLLLSSRNAEKEVYLKSDFAPELNAICNFEKEAIISSSNFPTKSGNALSALVTSSQIYSWKDSVSLKFQNGVDDRPIHFGDEIKVETNWAQSVRNNFPVDFNLKNCYVEAEKEEFEIIQNGCPAKIVDVRLKNSLRQKSFQWKSFSFQEQVREPQKLRCTVNFCLRDISCSQNEKSCV